MYVPDLKGFLVSLIRLPGSLDESFHEDNVVNLLLPHKGWKMCADALSLEFSVCLMYVWWLDSTEIWTTHCIKWLLKKSMKDYMRIQLYEEVQLADNIAYITHLLHKHYSKSTLWFIKWGASGKKTTTRASTHLLVPWNLFLWKGWGGCINSTFWFQNCKFSYFYISFICIFLLPLNRIPCVYGHFRCRHVQEC